MPINLKYQIPPSFVVDGTSYNECGDLRRALPFTGPTGIPQTLPFQMYSPFVEARFYRVLRFDNEQLQVARQEQQQLYYVSTGNFLGGSESRNAFIKSFTLSIENAYGATLEIVDTSGNDFIGFYNTVYKNRCWNRDGINNDNVVKPQEIFIVSVNVGYVFVNSEGKKAIYQPYVNSPSKRIAGRPIGPFINFFLHQIEVHVERNIWRYSLILKSADGPYSNVTVNKRIGSPGQQVPLLRAAEIMLNGDCPPRIAFDDPAKARVILAKPPQGANGEWAIGAEKGAGSAPNATKKGVYAGYNLPPLDAIRKNMDTFVTTSNKGVYMMFPTGANDDALYLVEADSTFCIQRRGSMAFCGLGPFLGTYVVNGGDYSPVIRFSPRINLVGIPNKAIGGQAGGGSNIKAVQVKDLCNPFDGNEANQDKNAKTAPGQDIAMGGAVANDAWDRDAPKNLPRVQAQAGVAAIAAENYSKPETAGAITATMTIQGDPRFLWSLNIKGGAIKIIFINPFAVFTQGPTPIGLQTDWLANPKINSMISDGFYTVTGCDHTISDGSWITELKLTQIPSPRTKLRG